MRNGPLLIGQALDYEVRSSWWAGRLLPHSFAVRYYARKVARRYLRYLATLEPGVRLAVATANRPRRKEVQGG